MTVRHVCAQCGTSAYNEADMVGNVCPQCWLENELTASVAEAQAQAEAVKAQLDEARKERGGTKGVTEDPGVPVHPAGEPTPPTDDSSPKRAVVSKTARKRTAAASK